MGKYINEQIEKWKKEHKGEVFHIDLRGPLESWPKLEDKCYHNSLLVLENSSYLIDDNHPNPKAMEESRKLIYNFLCGSNKNGTEK